MARNSRYRLFIVMEFSALAVLVVSFYYLGQRSNAGLPFNHFALGIPVVASLLSLSGFLGATYVRWLDSSNGTEIKPIQRILFAFLALSVLTVWAYAVHQTYASL